MARSSSRGRVKREPDLLPTPETARKLREDVLRRLYGEGHLTEAQFTAGMEIREIFDALSALWLRSPDHEAPPGQSAKPRHHLDGLPPDLRRRYLSRYLPWTRRAPRLWVETTIAVVVDCRPLVPPGGGWSCLVRGLDSYGRN